MNKQQVFLSVFGIVLIVLIFQLPTVVVENDNTSDLRTKHSSGVSSEDRLSINSMKAQMTDIASIEKYTNFADSLAGLYLKYQMTDSAVRVADWLRIQDSSESTLREVALIYFQAFNISGNKEYANQAAEIFETLVAESPNDLSLKNKLAMTLTASSTPMKGIMMLREILETDPENREAIFNLGLLAIQSGQWDRAEERFRQLIERANDSEAYFYLAIVLKELGKIEESKKYMNSYIEFPEADPALKATAKEFIREIENI